MARPQPTVPSRFGLAIKPVYASMAPDRSMVVVHRLVRALRLCMRCLPGFPARFGVIGIATPKTLLPFSIPPHLRPLPSAGITPLHQYYGPLRHPDRPGLSLAGFRLVRATPPTGLPVLRPSPSSMRAADTTPVEPAGARVTHFPRGWQPSPNYGRVGFHIGCFEACSAFTCVAARMVARPPKAQGQILLDARMSLLFVVFWRCARVAG